MIQKVNEEYLEAWEEELDKFIEVLEALEFARKASKNLYGANNASDTVQIAIDDMNIAASRAALKVGRLRRKENENGAS